MLQSGSHTIQVIIVENVKHTRKSKRIEMKPLFHKQS